MRARLEAILLPLAGFAGLLALWWLTSALWVDELPSPLETWHASKQFILEPWAKRGEMDQGILRFTWYSLVLVAKGYALALIIGTPIGFMLGLSKFFTKAFDPKDPEGYAKSFPVKSLKGEAAVAKS